MHSARVMQIQRYCRHLYYIEKSSFCVVLPSDLCVWRGPVCTCTVFALMRLHHSSIRHINSSYTVSKIFVHVHCTQLVPVSGCFSSYTKMGKIPHEGKTCTVYLIHSSCSHILYPNVGFVSLPTRVVFTFHVPTPVAHKTFTVDLNTRRKKTKIPS